MTTTTLKRCRDRDPDTARAAGRELNRHTKAFAVLEALCRHYARTGDGLTDGQLEALPEFSDWPATSGRCRRRDCRDLGYVQDSGRTREERGYKRKVWVPITSQPLVQELLARFRPRPATLF